MISCGSDDADPSGGGNSNLNLGPVGSSANDLLSSTNYRFLQVEIQYAEGFAPPQESINYLQNFMNSRLNKPAGITLSVSQTSAPGQASYTLEELRNIEDESRTTFTEDGKLAIYFYFADGNYDENENVLGIAHRNTSMVLFQKRIEELSGGVGQVSTELLTSSVLVHELGHILGLVNNGSEMQTPHQDEANGAHCDNEECLMYFSVESASGISDLLGMSSPPSLDANCLSDLAANGGK
ncbi:peptidase [Roseivirga sp.]|uniref:peptidase n=1 Tax=Roseivirga sp. TaxID=1964215 RepID=UPI003B52A8F4